MTILKDSKRDELFEYLPIMAIIDYKWEAYTRQFFMRQFRIFLGFISLFITSLFLQIQEKNELASSIAELCLNVIALCILFFLNKHELIILRNSNNDMRAYFQDYWNFIDIGLLITFATMVTF